MTLIFVEGWLWSDPPVVAQWRCKCGHTPQQHSGPDTACTACGFTKAFGWGCKSYRSQKRPTDMCHFCKHRRADHNMGPEGEHCSNCECRSFFMARPSEQLP